MIIKENEVEIIGKWVIKNSKIVKDENCIRIENLIKDYLIKIASDESGWDTLYKDPNDERYWELTYPNSDMSGGGPPMLKNLKNELAKYGLK